MATDIAQDDNDGALSGSRIVGRITYNASWNDIRDENMSCSQIAGCQLARVWWSNMCCTCGP